MKRLTLVLLTLGFLQIARAQFEGVLYYDCTIKNKTLTTIYVSKTKVLLESKIYPMKEGAAVIDKGREQDPLIFDFVANKTTRLSPRHKESVTGDLAPITEDRIGNLKDEDVSVEDLGTEKIGDYNCHHYGIRIKNKKSELWITKDLGTSLLCMASQFDYYPSGCLLFTKLKAVNADGVVVKSKAGNVVVNLTNVQKKTVSPTYFEIPAGYSNVKP
jgi:Domain of unknown function (DUF4412)